MLFLSQHACLMGCYTNPLCGDMLVKIFPRSLLLFLEFRKDPKLKTVLFIACLKDISILS